MNAEQIEMFRRAILDSLSANETRFGLPAKALVNICRVGHGLNVDENNVLDQLDYLRRLNPPLVETVGKVITQARLNWRITEDGLTYLDS